MGGTAWRINPGYMPCDPGEVVEVMLASGDRLKTISTLVDWGANPRIAKWRPTNPTRQSVRETLSQLADREELVYSAELYLLRRVAETGHNAMKGRNWPEFREVSGGQEVLDEMHQTAISDYRQWLAAGDG